MSSLSFYGLQSNETGLSAHGTYIRLPKAPFGRGPITFIFPDKQRFSVTAVCLEAFTF